MTMTGLMLRHNRVLERKRNKDLVFARKHCNEFPQIMAIAWRDITVKHQAECDLQQRLSRFAKL